MITLPGIENEPVKQYRKGSMERHIPSAGPWFLPCATIPASGIRISRPGPIPKGLPWSSEKRAALAAPRTFRPNQLVKYPCEWPGRSSTMDIASDARRKPKRFYPKRQLLHGAGMMPPFPPLFFTVTKRGFACQRFKGTIKISHVTIAYLTGNLFYGKFS